MKSYVFAALLVGAFLLVVATFSLVNTNLLLQLEVERAVAATGPCGTQFVVPLQKGDNKGKVAVAGQIVPATQAGSYFQSRGPDGAEEVYVSVDEGRETQFLFRRVPPTGCPVAKQN